MVVSNPFLWWTIFIGFAAAYRKSQGIDMDRIYREIPPE